MDYEDGVMGFFWVQMGNGENFNTSSYPIIGWGGIYNRIFFRVEFLLPLGSTEIRWLNRPLEFRLFT